LVASRLAVSGLAAAGIYTDLFTVSLDIPRGLHSSYTDLCNQAGCGAARAHPGCRFAHPGYKLLLQALGGVDSRDSQIS
jgi:hypothetical protein